MKFFVPLAGALFSLGGLAAKESLTSEKVVADINTEAWVPPPAPVHLRCGT